MKVKFKYGDSFKVFDIQDHHVLEVIKPPVSFPLPDVRQTVRNRLRQPDTGPSLTELLLRVRETHRVLIVVSDITRSIPQYPQILEELVEEINRSVKGAEIRFLIATGTHRPLASEEIRSIYGELLTDSYSFANHDCDSPDLIEIGRLSSGIPLTVNQLVKWADVFIVTGRVAPHYFSGFSGGRKSVLPGISGREVIRANHSRVAHPHVGLGKLAGNPIHEEMVEAAQLAGVDFALMVVMNMEKQAVGVFAGEIIETHEKACRVCLEVCGVTGKIPADCVVTSSGGFPQDLSVFQMQRTLQNTKALLKPGGSFLVFGEAREGIGQDTFETWLSSAATPDELLSVPENQVKVCGHTAVLTARLLVRNTVCMISYCAPEQLERIFFKGFSSGEEGLEFMQNRHGSDFTAYLVPDGTFLMAHQGALNEGSNRDKEPSTELPTRRHSHGKRSGSNGWWRKKRGRRSGKREKLSRVSFVIWGALLGMLLGYLVMWSNGSAGSILIIFWTNLIADIIGMIDSVVTFAIKRLAIIMGGSFGAVCGYFLYQWYTSKISS